MSLCTLGAGVTAVICIFGYLPQAAALTFVQGPVLAAVSAGVLVMSESAAVTTALARYWILGGALTDLFDAVSCCLF